MTHPVIDTLRLGAPPWKTFDPFLFCVHHNDRYPRANEQLGPDAPLDGRTLGQDFANLDGWNMYHGEVVPGFPSHPHRGFETITLARNGLIDHSDSLGARARFGRGDVQWMTAGKGIVHSEMFPLLHRSEPNHVELFQIWLNLPAEDKFVDPYFTMFWADTIPTLTFTDANRRSTIVTVIAGQIDHAHGPPPPPNSWASRGQAELAIWTIQLEPGGTWTVPPASPGLNRTVYVVQGGALQLAGTTLGPGTAARLHSQVPAQLQCGDQPTELLLLQGRPIGEPIARYGPFVMNTQTQIHQAFSDYQRTRFGGWPWSRPDPVHGTEDKRFALHADGTREEPCV